MDKTEKMNKFAETFSNLVHQKKEDIPELFLNAMNDIFEGPAFEIDFAFHRKEINFDIVDEYKPCVYSSVKYNKNDFKTISYSVNAILKESEDYEDIKDKYNDFKKSPSLDISVTKDPLCISYCMETDKWKEEHIVKEEDMPKSLKEAVGHFLESFDTKETIQQREKETVFKKVTSSFYDACKTGDKEAIKKAYEAMVFAQPNAKKNFAIDNAKTACSSVTLFNCNFSGLTPVYECNGKQWAVGYCERFVEKRENTPYYVERCHEILSGDVPEGSHVFPVTKNKGILEERETARLNIAYPSMHISVCEPELDENNELHFSFYNCPELCGMKLFENDADFIEEHCPDFDASMMDTCITYNADTKKYYLEYDGNYWDAYSNHYDDRYYEKEYFVHPYKLTDVEKDFLIEKCQKLTLEHYGMRIEEYAEKLTKEKEEDSVEKD